MTADDLIALLGLAPHPEGGHYRETYRAAGTVAVPGASGPRSWSTAIYFLLRGAEFSALHRIRSDEMWHYYAGDSALEVVELGDRGAPVTTRLGPDVAAGQAPQHVVPAGRWFGARLADRRPGRWSLVGCTVAPGFDFADFEMARRRELVAAHPGHEDLITSMTRG